MKTVAIIYGWAEGRWQSKRFVKTLIKNGFEITDNIQKANVIFAHSSGCYLVPVGTKAELIVLVGLPFWPGRSLASSIVRKLVMEIKYHRRHKGFGWWLNKMSHNSWYIITRPQATYYGITRHKVGNLPSGQNTKVLLVRPSDDTTHHPEATKKLEPAKNYKYIELPGAHDDCWMEPKPYVDLLLKEL